MDLRENVIIEQQNFLRELESLFLFNVQKNVKRAILRC